MNLTDFIWDVDQDNPYSNLTYVASHNFAKPLTAVEVIGEVKEDVSNLDIKLSDGTEIKFNYIDIWNGEKDPLVRVIINEVNYPITRDEYFESINKYNDLVIGIVALALTKLNQS